MLSIRRYRKGARSVVLPFVLHGLSVTDSSLGTPFHGADRFRSAFRPLRSRIARLRATDIDRTSPHTAILFFSHAPHCEWENKRFFRHDRSRSTKIVRTLYERTRAVLAESGLPVIHATQALQQGTTFGERLASAFAHAFAAGYEQVIAVGNDCPRLHEVDWTDVVRRLEHGQPVVGPTTGCDGAYLIGLRRSHFHAGAFAALPWQSKRLYGSLLRHLTARSAARVHTLASRGDLNSRQDLMQFLRAAEEAPSELRVLVRRLRAILDGAHIFYRVLAAPRSASIRVSRGRSPPVQAAPV